MNDLDNDMTTLGPQLLRGKRLVLTRGKQSMLSAWSVKLVLMLQLTHARDRLVIPADDYTRFYDERLPSDVMRIWAAFMEPPTGGDGGVFFGDYSYEEMAYGEEIVGLMGLDGSFSSRCYIVTVRLRHLVVSVLRVGHSEFLPFHVVTSPRQWTPIWPAHGHREWPPSPLASVVGIGRPPIWIRHAGAP
jgi:hypothetical protein